jgi:hypothetical protein
VCTRTSTPIPPSILEDHVPEMGKQAYEIYEKSQQANCFNQVIQIMVRLSIRFK